MEARLRGLLRKFGVEGGKVIPFASGAGYTRGSVAASEVKVLGGLGTGLVVDILVLRYSRPARLVVKPLSSFCLAWNFLQRQKNRKINASRMRVIDKATSDPMPKG